jgi:hypothetical protein
METRQGGIMTSPTTASIASVEGNSGQKPKRFFLWLLAASAALSMAAWGISVRNQWLSFKSDLISYHSISIGMTKAEVQYALDAPQTVQGPIVEAEDGTRFSNPLRVNSLEQNESIPPGYDPIPVGKSVVDYDLWHYWNSRGSFDVEFDESEQRVKSISCYSETRGGCETLFGLGPGTTEDEVIRLIGQPDNQEVLGSGEIVMGMQVRVSKSMRYDALGLDLMLSKRVVRSISKRSATSEISFWEWLTGRWI